MHPTDPTSASSVIARVNYLASADGAAAYVASVGGGDIAPHEGEFVTHEVSVVDGRGRHFDLDREGFALVPHPTRVDDFYDDEAIAGVYEAEVRELVASHLSATEVVIFDHTRRSASGGIRRSRQIREPSATIHNDYTERSARARLRRHREQDADLSKRPLRQRFAIVNVWRSIAGTIFDAPLALCDATSTRDADRVPVERKAQDRTGEIQFALHNPEHRWYFFPRMNRDEALLIKTYDEALDGRTRFTLHTAFSDPTAPSDAPARESIETRCFVFFD